MQKLAATQQNLAEAREKHAKQLATVTVSKPDVDMLATEWDHIPRAALEKHLRECGGDVSKAARQLIGLEPLQRGP